MPKRSCSVLKLVFVRDRVKNGPISGRISSRMEQRGGARSASGASISRRASKIYFCGDATALPILTVVVVADAFLERLHGHFPRVLHRLKTARDSVRDYAKTMDNDPHWRTIFDCMCSNSLRFACTLMAVSRGQLPPLKDANRFQRHLN